MVDIHDSLDWGVSSDINPNPPAIGASIGPPAPSVSPLDEKSKKLRLLAELKEATCRLEAELAVM